MENRDIVKENRYALLLQLSFYHAFYKWKNMPTLKLIDFFPDMLKKAYKEQNIDIFKDVRRCITKSIVTQYFMSLYELLEDNFDESMGQDKNKFSKVKLNIDCNGNLKSINARQVFNLIRQAFAHNNEEDAIPHWNWDGDSVVINRQFKKNKIQMKMHVNELVSLANMYLNNALENPRVAISLYPNRTMNALLQKKLNSGNAHKYVWPFDMKTKTNMSLDKFQKKAIYDFFVESSNGLDKNKISMGIHPFYPEFVIKKFPFKCNANNVAKDCQKTIQLLYYFDNGLLKRDEYIETILAKEQNPDFLDLYDYIGPSNRLQACIGINILFSIFTYVEPDRVKNILSKYDIELRHLRNSIMHGRYYFNYQNGFNFYDGIIGREKGTITLEKMEKNIEYVGTLSLEDIDQIAMELLDEYIKLNESKNVKS